MLMPKLGIYTNMIIGRKSSHTFWHKLSNVNFLTEKIETFQYCHFNLIKRTVLQ